MEHFSSSPSPSSSIFIIIIICFLPASLSLIFDGRSSTFLTSGSYSLTSKVARFSSTHFPFISTHYLTKNNHRVQNMCYIKEGCRCVCIRKRLCWLTIMKTEYILACTHVTVTINGELYKSRKCIRGKKR